MHVEIERAKTKDWWVFKGSPVVRVTVVFSEEEKEVIKRAPLYDYIIYEAPYDKILYEEWQQARIEKPEGYLGRKRSYPTYLHNPPRYQHTRSVRHFLEKPTHDIHPFGDEMAFINVEKTVEATCRELKNIIEGISTHPQEKRTLEL